MGFWEWIYYLTVYILDTPEPPQYNENDLSTYHVINIPDEEF